MFNVIGLDLSYSRTGFAHIVAKPDGAIESFSLDKFKTAPNTPLLERIASIRLWICDKIYNIDNPINLIVVESAVFGGKRASMLSGLNLAVLVFIFETWVNCTSCDVLLVPPPTLKRFVGVIGTSKTPIVTAFKKLHPDAPRVCHDEVDAYFLASLGVSYKVAQAGGVISKVANNILFSNKLTKKGKPKGLTLRQGEFFYKGGLKS